MVKQNPHDCNSSNFLHWTDIGALKNAADEEMGFESKRTEYTGLAVHRLNN